MYISIIATTQYVLWYIQNTLRMRNHSYDINNGILLKDHDSVMSQHTIEREKIDCLENCSKNKISVNFSDDVELEFCRCEFDEKSQFLLMIDSMTPKHEHIFNEEHLKITQISSKLFKTFIKKPNNYIFHKIVAKKQFIDIFNVFIFLGFNDYHMKVFLNDYLRHLQEKRFSKQFYIQINKICLSYDSIEFLCKTHLNLYENLTTYSSANNTITYIWIFCLLQPEKRFWDIFFVKFCDQMMKTRFDYDFYKTVFNMIPYI